MAEQIVETVRRAVESLETFWALLDDYVVWDLRESQTLDLHRVYVGREAVIEASRHYWGTWEDYRVEAEELIEAGSTVVVVGREIGRGKGSGVPIERQVAQLWTLHRGKLIRSGDLLRTRPRPSKPPGSTSSALGEKRYAAAWRSLGSPPPDGRHRLPEP